MPGLWLHELLWLWLLLGGCLAGKILGFLCSCQCRLLGLLLGFLGCLHKGFGRGLTLQLGQDVFKTLHSLGHIAFEPGETKFLAKDDKRKDSELLMDP